mmetsp:Transcript_90198/g.291589  ORF Transcript_90198/g.291589 Transcript_90198/m.291589 type:complete len:204 (+) Transcript_90198:445-1056(+)
MKSFSMMLEQDEGLVPWKNKNSLQEISVSPRCPGFAAPVMTFSSRSSSPIDPAICRRLLAYSMNNLVFSFRFTCTTSKCCTALPLDNAARSFVTTSFHVAFMRSCTARRVALLVGTRSDLPDAGFRVHHAGSSRGGTSSSFFAGASSAPPTPMTTGVGPGAPAGSTFTSGAAGDGLTTGAQPAAGAALAAAPVPAATTGVLFL